MYLQRESTTYQSRNARSSLDADPADTKHSIYVVFMLEGYVKIMLDFMLECLVFLT